MRRHPSHAIEILGPIEFLSPALDIPHYHHERWDGTGYPCGLAGEQIPLSARIFAAADIWDALSHDRPYRKALPQERVREHLRSLAGTHLDPQVVEAFLDRFEGDSVRKADSTSEPGEVVNVRNGGDGFARVGLDTSASGSGTQGLVRRSAESPCLSHPRMENEVSLVNRRPPLSVCRGLSILIAEDHAPSALGLKLRLEAMGHKVLITNNGDEAWAIVQQGRERLVISDWKMPGIDGLELCRRIRSLSGRLYTYIILMIGKGRTENRLEGFQAGADDFMTKPLDPRELASRVEIAGRVLNMQEEILDRSVQLEQMQAELFHRNERLVELAMTDSLTGLKNRRHFLEALEANASLAARQGKPLSIVMLDVDRFKRYNDTFGHRAGDEVLARIATILRNNVRNQDEVARYGGEEFIILLPRTDAPNARGIAERLRAALAENPWRLRRITASLGVATAMVTAKDVSWLLEEANQALYQAKRRGRNRVIHHEEMSRSFSGVLVQREMELPGCGRIDNGSSCVSGT